MLLSRVEIFAARRDLHQADKANLWAVLSALREIRARHRSLLGQLSDLDAGTAAGSGGATGTPANAASVAGQGGHHADF